MRLLLIAILLFFFTESLAQNNHRINRGKPPEWIVSIPYPHDLTDSIGATGGYWNLLIEEQHHLQEQRFYYHYAQKVYSESGLEIISRISVDFDPAYEKLVFHSIDIYRNGKKTPIIDRIHPQLLKREKSLESSTYDGDLTAVYNLEDLQVGDVVDYTYTIEGSNPLYAPKFARFLYFKYSVPIGTIHYRILQAGPEIKIKSVGEVPTVQQTTNKGLNSYAWTARNVKAYLGDDQTPGWYNPFDYVQISDFGDWSDLGAWLVKIYSTKTSTPLLGMLKNLKRSDTLEAITTAVRFVQDEIRYLSMSQGIHNMKPHEPQIINRQRYGDCKDKSVLLASLIRELGLPSHPVLVNTSFGKSLPDYMASPSLFDHCIVQFQFRDSTYWIDPTISLQRGALADNYLPRYYHGLVIAPNAPTLVKIPESKSGRILLQEDFYVDSIGGGARLVVQTTYSREQANSMRGYFLSNSLDEVGKQYTNFYSNDYPFISLAKPIVWKDLPEFNTITTREEYDIQHIWNLDSASKKSSLEFYARTISTYLVKPTAKIRKSPLAISFPASVEQRINIHLPEPWPLDVADKKIETEGFLYTSRYEKKDSIITLIYSFNAKRPYLEASAVRNHITKTDEALNDLSFFIWHTKPGESGGKYSVQIVFILTITIVTSLFGFLKLYNKDPEPRPGPIAYQSIGGWLILPAIGLVISPFLRLYQVSEIPYFSETNWLMLVDSGYSDFQPTKAAFILLELLLNCLMIVLGAFATLVFFLRRTVTPYVVSAYYVANLVILLGDSILGLQFGVEIDRNTVKEIIQALGSAAVWVPYFLISDRSRGTFTVRKFHSDQSEVAKDSSYP